MSSATLPKVIHRRYRYVQELGQGGMGRVVLVEDLERGGQPLALKWVDYSSPPSAHELRHLREFQILSRFRHPHIVGVHNYGVAAPQLGRFFTCDYLAGPPVCDLLGQLDASSCHTIISQLLQALALIHAQGWVHGDIKPENLLLRTPLDEGAIQSCLVDFGLAHPELRPPEEKILGTVFYMAPERILGARMDRRGDLYSVGVLAYQMFTGQLPFPGTDKMTVLEGHIRTKPRPPCEIAQISPRLNDLILALLAKKPADRPARAEEVLGVLSQEFGTPAQPESLASTQSYFHHLDDCGWEDTISLVTGCVMRRSGAGTEVVEQALQGHGSDSGHAYEAMPLLPRERGSSTTGMMILRSPVGTDLARFRELLTLRVETLGLPVVQISAASGATTFVELIRGVLAHIPDETLAASKLFRSLTNELPVTTDAVQQTVHTLLNWLEHVASEFNLVIQIESLETANSALCQLLTEVALREREGSALRHITWIGFQGHAPDLYASQWLQDETTVHWAQLLRLRPFDPEAMNRWLELRLPDWQIPYPLQSLLQEESEGSPSLLQAILCSLAEEGVLRKGWQGWELDEQRTEELRVSPLVRETVVHYHAEPAQRQRILEGLAAMGGSGDLEWIRRITGLETTVVIPEVTELQRRGWITREVDGARFRFLFGYQSKAVREGMADGDWQSYNRFVADWLLQRELGGFEVSAERLASHLTEAGDTEAALPYVRKAVRESVEEGRPLAAIHWLEIVLSSGSLALDERVLLLDQLAELRQQWGPAQEVEQLRRQAVELSAQAAGAGEVQLSLHEKLARSEGMAGDFARAFQRLNSALHLYQGADRIARSRGLLLLITELNIFRGTPEQVDEIWPLIAQPPPDTAMELLGNQYSIGCSYRLAKGQRSLALEYLLEGIGRLDNVAHPLAAAWSNYLLGRHQELCGRSREAAGQYRLAAYLFQRVGQSQQMGRALLRVGELAHRAGQSAEAEEYLKRAEALFERIGASVEQPRIAWLRGLLLARSGWVKEAVEQFGTCHHWCKRYPRTPWRWECYLAQAEVDLCRGRLDAARDALLGPAHPTHAPHGDGPEPWIRWCLLTQEYALKAGEPGVALTTNFRALQEVRERGDLPHQVTLWWERWHLLTQFGCELEAKQLATQLRSWLEKYPVLRRHRMRRHTNVDEQEVLLNHDEQRLAAYYYEQGKAALLEEEWTKSLFLFEEAEFHAKRVRAQPWTALIGARMACVREMVYGSAPDADAIIGRAWKTFERLGVLAGRGELLTMWADLREAAGDPRSAESLRESATREVEHWSSRVPFPHDTEALARWLGVGSVAIPKTS